MLVTQPPILTAHQLPIEQCVLELLPDNYRFALHGLVLKRHGTIAHVLLLLPSAPILVELKHVEKVIPVAQSLLSACAPWIPGPLWRTRLANGNAQVAPAT